MTVRYRQTWRQVLPYAGALFAMMALRYDGRGIDVVDALPAAAIVCAAGAAVRREGVVVTPEEVTVIRIRRKTIPWSRVEAVERHSAAGGHGLRLVVGGRRIWLPAPVHARFLAPDKAFEEKAATIERYWRAATAPRDGAPAPAT